MTIYSSSKRFSKYITPLLFLLDLGALNGTIYLISDADFLNTNFLVYTNIAWILIAFYVKFYRLFRFSTIYNVLTLLGSQFALFTLTYFSYFGIFKEGQIINNQLLILTSIFLWVTLIKFVYFFAIKQYRSTGNNFRNVIVLGMDDSAKKIIQLFKEKPGLGYRYKGFFSNEESSDENYLGRVSKSKEYIIENDIDEIYCTLSELKKEAIQKFTQFASQNDRILKLIPNSDELYSKNQSIEYYDNTLIVLNVKKLPFEYPENHVLKRVFDICFSTVVFITVLTWLVPIIWILIRLESKGPVFFKQEREGIRGKPFICFKFRSMRVNTMAHKTHAKKNDNRVTKIGAILRKTSIDELPQFLNVLKGDMSVVGPRPHIENLAIDYQKDVENYIERHAVKPGITGLAQVSGYRGEVKIKADIKNRVRLDIFYIENWSFLLDIKIIAQTVFNVVKGDEKAY